MNEELEKTLIQRLSRSISGLNGISILIFLILIVGIVLLPLYPVSVHFEREGVDFEFSGGYYTAFPIGMVLANDFGWNESETWMEGSSSVVQETDYVTTPVWGILYVPYVMVAYFISRIPKYLLEKRRGGTKSLEGRSDT
ncbi:MAG: hypothetical protein KAR39_09085 [Thermoplasmata archaeon]|nr:hypothetical protein [Thermoplasmata archaeon]